MNLKTTFTTLLLPALSAGMAVKSAETNWVSVMPPARHPELVYWFWRTNTLADGQYLRDVERIAKESPFTLTFLTDRGVGFYNFGKMHDIFAKTVAAAHKQHLKVGLQLWEKPDSKTSHLSTSQAVALVSEDKIILDSKGHAEYSFTNNEARGRKPFRSELLKAYAFQESAPGFYLPDSLQDVSSYARTLKSDDPAQVKGVIDAPASLAGKTVYLLAAQYYNQPDLFGDVAINDFQDALQHYADIPFDGAALDEYGWMMVNPNRDHPFRDRIYGLSFAAEFKKRTGIPLERNLFDMRFAPAGEPAVRMRAINDYFEVLRDGSLRVEQAFRQMSQKIFGEQIFSGIHDTYHNRLDGADIWRTGLNWWNLPRDYGQSDENNPYPTRTGLLVAHAEPVEFDQFYNHNLTNVLRKAIDDARFGGRIHYHAWNDNHRHDGGIPDLDISHPDVLSAIESVEEKIRLLNQFDPPAPRLPVLVVFGMPALLDWYPDEATRSPWDINRIGDTVEEKANAIWQAGYPCALVPSDLIANGQITLDADNHPVINGHQFQAVVYLHPQYAKKKTLEFFEQYVQRGGKLMLEGQASNDFAGNDIRDRFDKLAARATVRGFDVAKLAQLGVSPSPLDHGAFMEDGSVVFTDFDSFQSGKPKSFSVTLCGHKFSGSYIGVCALKVNSEGGVEKFACGGFTQLLRDNQIVFSIPQPADTVIRLGKDGEYEFTIVHAPNNQPVGK
jgi:hypothetical protein